MERKYSRDLKKGEKALVKGWVKQVRDLGGLKFFILRDREGQVQVTVKKEDAKKGLIDKIGSLSREDCVSVTGMVKESRQAPGGLEIFPDEIEVVAPHTSTDMEVHRKRYLEGVSKSTFRPEYPTGADFTG